MILPGGRDFGFDGLKKKIAEAGARPKGGGVDCSKGFKRVIVFGHGDFGGHVEWPYTDSHGARLTAPLGGLRFAIKPPEGKAGAFKGAASLQDALSVNPTALKQLAKIDFATCESAIDGENVASELKVQTGAYPGLVDFGNASAGQSHPPQPGPGEGAYRVNVPPTPATPDPQAPRQRSRRP